MPRQLHLEPFEKALPAAQHSTPYVVDTSPSAAIARKSAIVMTGARRPARSDRRRVVMAVISL